MADQKGIVQIIVKKESREYAFNMDIGAPLGECYDACHEILNEIVKMSQAANDRAARPVEPEVVQQ